MPFTHDLCLAAAALCGLGLLAGLAGFLMPALVGCTLFRRSALVVLIGILALTLKDVMSLLQGQGEAWALVAWLGVIGVGAFVIQEFSLRLRDRLQPRALPLTLLLVSGAASVWLSQRIQLADGSDLQALESNAEADTLTLARLHASNTRAFTDRGHAVPLFTVSEDRKHAFAQNLGQDKRFVHLLQHVIQTAPATFRSNCHGWVFTGGAFIVDGDVVEQILRDNNYRLVDEPRPNDLIIYRDPYGHVAHSGIVKIAAAGLVLIESKWGNGACYVHEPSSSIYSQRFTYYRSPRSGHLLHGVQESGNPGE